MPPSPPARPAAGQGQRKTLGVSRTTLIVGAAVFTGAAIWFFLRRKNSGAQAGTPATTGQCTDQYGNPVDCPEQGVGVDYSGELSVIQTELESLLAAQGQGAAGGGGTTGGTTGGGTGTKPPSSGGGTPGKKPSVPRMPEGARVTSVNKTGGTFAWNPSPGATSYQIRVTYQGKLVLARTVPGTAKTGTISGSLRPNRTYTIHIKACNSAGCSSETNGPTMKTKL